MLNQALTFRFEEQGAGKVKGAVEGLGKATEKAGDAAGDAGKAYGGLSKEITKALEAARKSLAALEKTNKAAATKLNTEQWGMYRDSVNNSTSALDAFKAKGLKAFDAMGGASGILSSVASGAAKGAAAVAALGAAAVASAKQVLDLATAGQGIKNVAQAFENLGGTAKELEGMREAVGNTVSDSDLMKIKNLTSLFNIAGDQVGGLTKLALGASKALNISVGKALEDTFTAVARQSVMIMDNQGVQMGKLEAIYESFAAKSGVAVSSLTAEQKQYAFAQDAMLKGSRQMALAESAKSDAIAQSTASLENMKNTFLVFFTEVVQSSGVLDILQDSLGMLSKVFEENRGDIETFIDVGLEVLVESFRLVAAAVVPMMPHLLQLGHVFAGLLPTVSLLVSAVASWGAMVLSLIDLALRPLMLVLGGFLQVVGKAASALGMDGIGGELERAGAQMAKHAIQADKATDALKREEAGAKKAAQASKQLAKQADAVKVATGGASEAIRIYGKNADGTARSLDEAREAFAKGGNLNLFESALESTTMTVEEAQTALANYRETFGLLGGAHTDAASASALFDKALAITGGSVEEADDLVTDYLENIRLARKTLEDMPGDYAGIRRGADGLGIAIHDVAAGLREVDKLGEMVTEHVENVEAARAAQATKDKPRGGGGGQRRARRELIFEASIIGLTDVQKSVVDINKQLAENLKVAGKSAEAIQAAHLIAAQRLGPLMAQTFGETGMAMAGHFSRAFEVRMEQWARNWAPKIRAIGEGFSKALNEGAALAGEGLNKGAVVANAMAVVAAMEEARGMSINVTDALTPARDVISSTRAEVDGLLASFDGEATSAANESLLMFADSIELVVMSVGDNIGALSEAMDELGKAMDMTDAGAATEATFNALSKGAGAAINIGKAATAAFTKDKKKQAKIMGAFEVAEAIRSAVNLDFIGAIGHSLAAVKYFAISGGGAGNAKGAAGGTKQRAKRQRTELTKSSALLDRRGGAPGQVNQYFFSALDGRAPGELVIDALGAAAQRRTGARIPSRLVSDGNIQTGL